MTVKRFWACWFCGKTTDEVEILIAGPNDICICNRCVKICNDIIAEHKAKKKETK